MRGAEVVEIGSRNAAECSRRLLSAVHGADWQGVNRELSRARRICERTVRDASLAGEQADLLEAIVDRMGVGPCGDTELFLLGHLAAC
jgi:hypothetical protein